MFNIPKQYKTDVKIKLKDFIPKNIKAEDKKRIRESVKEVTLMYQIAGEEIPSVVNEEYKCQVIQFYDMELADIKYATYLATIYQSVIKPMCVLHMHDSMTEVYSFALKRLNQMDEMQIVIENSILTEKYPVGLPDISKNRLLECLDFVQIKNKTNKVNLYKEWFFRVYMLENEKAYTNVEMIMNGNHWYDAQRAEQVFRYYQELVNARVKLKKAITNVERMQLNKELKKVIEKLDRENY